MNEVPMNRIATRPTEDETVDLLTVAKMLRVHPVTVRRMIEKNKIVAPFRAGYGLRWKRSAIESWIAAGGTGDAGRRP